MAAQTFDPFRDRLSRDIRNELSKAFAKSLALPDMGPVNEVADRYLAQAPGQEYRAYVRDRLARYARAFGIIDKNRAKDALARALVLWDLELFFEAHEILEQAWSKAVGREKRVLQAMIRAAGMYILLEHGNIQGARKLAAKAAATLSAQRDAVPKIFDLDLLLNKLGRVDPVPPKLLPGN